MSQPESIPLIEAVHDLRVARDTDLRSAISQAPTRAGTPRPKIPGAEARKWYEGTYIPQCQAAGKRPSEAMDWADAKLKFGNKVRRDQIRDLRRALAPDDWRMQGRRPSLTNSAKNSAE